MACLLVAEDVTAGHPDRLADLVVESLVEAGVGMFQVRDKTLPPPLLAERVRLALAVGRRDGGGPILVVNDRVDVAAACGADGAHVGADDLPVPLARRVVGAARPMTSPRLGPRRTRGLTTSASAPASRHTRNRSASSRRGSFSRVWPRRSRCRRLRSGV